MQLILLGTGCPKVDYHRFGPANLISTSKVKILIDCGSGVTQRLEQKILSSANIDALFLTHLHSDHVIDLYQLIISSWHQYRKKKWKIIGPKGTKKFIKLIMNAWKEERNLRIKYEKRETLKAFNIEVTELEKNGRKNIKDIEVQYFRVDHRPVVYAFGYNFINNNKKITISGDTRPCKNINKFALNSQILLHEVFIEKEIKPIKGVRSVETLNNVKSYHTLSTEVGKIAKKVNANNLVLTHFVPPIFNKKRLIDLVKLDYGKKPIIGEDLMTINTDGSIKRL